MYTLFTNTMHIIQPLDLVLRSIKKLYCEEMHKWLLANIGEAYDKCQFIDVFCSTYDTSAMLFKILQLPGYIHGIHQRLNRRN